MSMNEIDNTSNEDLDTFSAEFFGQSPAIEDAPTEEIVEQETEAVDAAEEATPEEDTHPEEEDQTEEEKPKGKKSSYQDRINELTAARREAERREVVLQKQLEEILAKLETPKETKTESSIPDPEALNADGTEKYPLGEFDPNYISDRVKFEVNERMQQVESQRKAEAEAQKIAAQQETLRSSWNEKVEVASEKYEDFQQKGNELLSTIGNIDPSYSDYLANTIMSLDNGPDVLYYLANNPLEVQKIINSGATTAAIAFGRIDARFELSKEKKEETRPRITKAPTPPASLNKGAAASIPISADTDNLDDFENMFFKKKSNS